MIRYNVNMALNALDILLRCSEAVVRKCSIKRVFLGEAYTVKFSFESIL